MESGWTKGIVAISVAALWLGACGGSSSDLQEIKKGQKDILAKLESLEKGQKTLLARVRTPARPTRAPLNPNKVYDIPIGSSPFRGPRNAPVTVVEFGDFQ